MLVINLKKFKTFCFETNRIFKEKYPWYPMLSTIHKILYFIWYKFFKITFCILDIY